MSACIILAPQFNNEFLFWGGLPNKKVLSFLHDKKYVIRVMIPHAGTLKLQKLSVATEGPSLQLLGENH